MIRYLKNLNLLYVENNIEILEQNKKYFEILFKTVYACSSYTKALNTFKEESLDLLISDTQINTEKNGFDVAYDIRFYDSTLPIIFLTAENKKELIIKAINTNINGYLIKPLEIDKLIDILDRLFINNEKRIKFNNFIYDFNSLELMDINLKKILLGKKENKLLSIFLNNTNKIFSREELEYEIWDEPVVSPSLLKNLIASLRNKIGKDTIINESKIGWRINIY